MSKYKEHVNRYPTIRFVFPNLTPDILQVSQQFPVLLQLSIMLLSSLYDSFPCRQQVVKCLHHQLNLTHFTGSTWNWLSILPSKFNLHKPVTANRRQETCYSPVADGPPGNHVDGRHMVESVAHYYHPTTSH